MLVKDLKNQQLFAKLITTRKQPNVTKSKMINLKNIYDFDFILSYQFS